MKSLLLTICIAALTTPANARPWAAFYCGKDQIAWLPSKYFDPGREKCAGPYILRLMRTPCPRAREPDTGLDVRATMRKCAQRET